MRGRLATLKIRADFLRVAATRARAAMPGLLLQAAPRRGRAPADATMRVGFTASRKVGNAVVRNRAKRRLRAAAAEVLPREGRPGTDYVLVARAATAERPYRALVEDLQKALRRVDRSIEERGPVAGEEG
jgi:ribonuclease P protein component